MRIGSLFSGYGGLDMAARLVWPGAEVGWVSEIDPSGCRVLAETCDAPNHGDITKIDWAEVEPVDILTGGFPCQDVSLAGLGKGIGPDPRRQKVADDERTRSGLWWTMRDAVGALRPRWVVAENVSALLTRGGPEVTWSLAELGYVGSWVTVRASDVGAPHRRSRVFLVAWPADADGGSSWVSPELPAVWPAPMTLPTPTVGDSRGGRNATSGRKEGSQHHSGYTLCDIAYLDHFGKFAPAIEQWERILGRRAPAPLSPERKLEPPFVEWMMGLPAGHVTGWGLSHTAQLRTLGGGVVPQQGAFGIASALEQAGGVPVGATDPGAGTVTVVVGSDVGPACVDGPGTILGADPASAPE